MHDFYQHSIAVVVPLQPPLAPMKLNPFLLCSALVVSVNVAARAADTTAATTAAATAVSKPKPVPVPLPADLIQITDAKPIAVEGEHNAFPVMTQWKGQIWLMYRRAVAH